MARKRQSLRADMSRDEKRELTKIAKILDIPIAQIVREGTREKMEELKRTHPKVQAAFTSVEVAV
jgi:hypothetical protein